MQERVSEAVVLNREEAGDLDLRASFFTRRYGKIVAKAKSARKITSKLSGHLDTGNLVLARFVEKGGLQVVDALKEGRANLQPADLYFLHLMLAEGEPDARIWQMLVGGKFRWQEALKALGWDPALAACGECGKNIPAAFHVGSQEFFCAACASAAGIKEVLYINAQNPSQKHASSRV